VQRLATPESPQKGKKKKRAQEKEYKTTAAMEPAVEKSWVNVNSEKRQCHDSNPVFHDRHENNEEHENNLCPQLVRDLRQSWECDFLLSSPRGVCDSGIVPESRESLSEILDERFRIINVGIDPHAVRGSSRFDFIELKFMRDVFNDFGQDRPLLFDVSVDE
jgi:hypothetical protein